MTKVKTKIKNGSKGLNLAPSRASMPRFWQATGEQRRIKCDALTSRAGDIYLVDAKNEDVTISAGRKWSVMQTIDADSTVTIIAKIMEPNSDITKAQLAEIEEEFGAKAIANYVLCLEEDYVQLHLHSVEGEDDDDDDE